MAAASALKGAMIDLARVVPAYVSLPSGPTKGGLVVIQEWGINANMKSICDRFAAEGFVSVCPDLYRGKLAKDAQEANHLMTNLDFAGAVDDIAVCAENLKNTYGCGKVGVLGFCMGGALTLLASAKCRQVNAGVCFYGIPPAEAADLSKIKIKILGHFAEKDTWCNTAAVGALEETFKAGGVAHTFHTYPADHAFMNKARPEVYNEELAELAWSRTIAFLNEEISS